MVNRQSVFIVFYGLIVAACEGFVNGMGCKNKKRTSDEPLELISRETAKNAKKIFFTKEGRSSLVHFLTNY